LFSIICVFAYLNIVCFYEWHLSTFVKKWQQNNCASVGLSKSKVVDVRMRWNGLQVQRIRLVWYLLHRRSLTNQIICVMTNWSFRSTYINTLSNEYWIFTILNWKLSPFYCGFKNITYALRWTNYFVCEDLLDAFWI
jgi:hypothetical protein